MGKITRRHERDGSTRYVHWEMVSPYDEFRSVEATWERGGDTWPWSVGVSVAEFIREEPLEGEMTAAVEHALSRVRGVVRFEAEDRGTWLVEGRPRGRALVRTVHDALLLLVPRFIAHVDDLSV